MSIDASGASLPTSLALVAMLGFCHGFNVDHISVVDGITRMRQLHDSSWTARLGGAQFAIALPVQQQRSSHQGDRR